MNIHFLNYHQGEWGVFARAQPMVLFGEGDRLEPALTNLTLPALADASRGRDVVFVTHGFNVTFIAGLRSIGRFAARLKLDENALVVGVLWPGDVRVPFTGTAGIAVNYPLASKGAIGAGQSLGDLCNGALSGAASFSFVSHSLGARVVLEAVQRLKAKARLLCVTAGAINNDCLTGQYADAAEHALTTRVLASTQDWVLQVLFQIGDPVSQVLDHLPGHLGPDDHPPFRLALGRLGPQPKIPAPVHTGQIAEAQNYGHGNYLAPSDAHYSMAMPDDPDVDKWLRVAEFVSSAQQNGTPAWPPAYVPPNNLRPWYWPFGK